MTAKVGTTSQWIDALEEALLKSCERLLESDKQRVFRTKEPFLALSGLTPGPFYHSHPHVASEFDEIPMRLGGQVRDITGTMIAVAKNAGMDMPAIQSAWERTGHLIHWVCSDQYQEVEDAYRASLEEHGLSSGSTYHFPIVGCSTDPRIQVESMPLMAAPTLQVSKTGMERIDIAETFDAQFFMPYLAGILVPRDVELVLFSVDADSAGCDGKTPVSAADQVSAVVDRITQVLQENGCGPQAEPRRGKTVMCPYRETFADRKAAQAAWDGVVIILNKTVGLSKNQDPFIMTRSQKGVDCKQVHPVSEALLEVESLGYSSDGVPLLLENVVVAARGIGVLNPKGLEVESGSLGRKRRLSES